MDIIEVGLQLPERFSRHIPVSDDSVTNLAISMGERVFLIGVKDPKPAEEYSFRHDPIQIGYRLFEHLMAFGLQVGNQTIAEFTLNVGPFAFSEDGSAFENLEDGSGYLCDAIFLDSSTHVVKGIRTFTITPFFSSILLKDARKLEAASRKGDFNFPKSYRYYLDQCKSPRDLMASYKYSETAGMHF